MTSDLQTLSLSLSMLMREKARIQEQMSSIAAEEATLRDAIQSTMQEQGYKTFEGNGLQLVRSNRKSVTVTDENALRDYLTTTGVFDGYQKFDLVSAKKDAAKNGWPGVEQVVTDVLSVKETQQ